jgi:hypothetical protein
MSLIEMRNIKKEYFLGETTVHALKGIDLNVDNGEFVAVCPLRFWQNNAFKPYWCYR